MNVPRVIGILFILTLLGIGALLGCTRQSKVTQPTPTFTAQPVETVSEPEPVIDNTPSVSQEAPGQPSTTLVLIADEITTLEPYGMIRVHPDESIARHIWDTLTWLNDDLQIEPHLAESWRLVNNFTWEFKLRQGITFHNGEALNAQAVRFSIEYAQSRPGSLETFAQDVDLDQVEIVDDYTLRISTHQPIVNLPFHLAFLEILPPLYYAETAPEQLALAPIGSGPYRLAQWDPNQGLVLEAVPTYWKGAPALPRLEFQVVPSAQERLAALREGEADLITDLPPQAVSQWDSPSSRLEAIESTQRLFIGIRVQADTPLDDNRVRQALNYGVNVEPIVDQWLEGYGERYASWVNPPANNLGLAPWPYDPQQARNLLAEAGYQQGFTTTLYTPIGVYHQDVALAQAIAQQLNEIGIGVNVQSVEWAAFVQRLLSDDVPPLFLLGINSRGDGLEDVKNLSAAFALNPTGWQNESFEDILEQAKTTFDPNARARLLDEAQAIAYDQAPWIWLWRSFNFYGINQGLDWTPRRDGLVYLYQSTILLSESTE